MPKRALVLSVLCVFAAFALTAYAAASPQKSSRASASEKSSHLQRGLADFERGFYELLPKGRRAEADQALTAAVKELELALETEPSNRDAHRTLGRIHALRENHKAAAEHYLRLTEIDPYDLDSYVLAALSLAKDGRLAESRVELEKAKGRTADPDTLALLDGYLAKLAEASKRAGAGR